MQRLKPGEYLGVLFDVLSDQVMETSPVIRATPDAAYRDAQAMVATTNEMADAFDDESDGNTTIGRCDDSYCFVQDHNGVMWDFPVVRAEERQRAEA